MVVESAHPALVYMNETCLGAGSETQSSDAVGKDRWPVIRELMGDG